LLKAARFIYLENYERPRCLQQAQTLAESQNRHHDMTKVWISELEFNDGTKISLDKNEVVVFVGPNNAGKSATLKEASSLLKSKV